MSKPWQIVIVVNNGPDLEPFTVTVTDSDGAEIGTAKVARWSAVMSPIGRDITADVRVSLPAKRLAKAAP